MKLQYLGNISGGGQFANMESEQIVRLYAFDRFEAANLKAGIQHAVVESQKSLALNRFEFIECVNCQLTLRPADEDLGISTEDNQQFYCDLTTASYKQMVKLIEPFTVQERSSYQFLYDLDNPIEFLFAPRGKDEEEED